MNFINSLHTKAILPLLVICTLAHAADPVVSNISAIQRAGTKLVDINYDVIADTATVYVSLAISNDGGMTFAVPAETRSGAVGAGITIGNGKTITWNAGADWDGRPSSQLRFKVTADDLVAPVDFVTIPPGDFLMGNTTDADAPRVNVKVSAFYISKYEVSKSNWDRVRVWAISNGYTDLAVGVGKANNHPVVSVKWSDAIKYCNARSQMEGLLPCYYEKSGAVMKIGKTPSTVNWSADGYRLPTEAEWEKASGGTFPNGGGSIRHSDANYYATPYYDYDLSGAERAWSNTYLGHYHPDYEYGAKPYTSPVGKFNANRYGLHDMAGNVSEWCWDAYFRSAYKDGVTDPRGGANSSFDPRVVRGGGWASQALFCRIHYRSYDDPDYGYNNTGLRVARSLVLE